VNALVVQSERHAFPSQPKRASDMSAKHPGFRKVQKKIEVEGYTKEQAGAILASKTRHASQEAKEKNPRLRKVKSKAK
jgi:hypothetical protein